MLKGKFVVVLVLLMLPFLAVSQTVMGQAYVTQTTTTIVTNTQVSTVTQGSVVTATSSRSQSIFSSPLTLPPTHGVCGTYFDQPFNATSGVELSGNLTADNIVEFYVMTDAAYQDWSHKIVAGGNCTPASLLLGQKDTRSYNFTVQIPTDGLYQIVVNNLSTLTVNAHLTANLSTAAPVTFTTVTYSTSTQPNVQTLTLITLEQAPSQGNDNSTLIFGAVIILIIIVIAVIARARRTKAAK